MVLIDITYRKRRGGFSGKKTACALGYFDGLHLGHKYVIEQALKKQESGLASAVFTFNCDTTLPKFQKQEDIVSFDNKREMLEQMGVKYLFAPDFAEVCGYSAEDFAGKILAEKLNAGFVCCGGNFRFGKNSRGTPEKLIELGKFYGFEVKIAEDVCLDGEMISSTQIRELIRGGEIERANRLLGYELRFNLPVVHGNKLGRTINFPTINQIIPRTNVVPKMGTYESRALISRKIFRAITNIGIRPTVSENDEVVMETHIFGINKELYGEKISVSLVRFLREERKFEDLGKLKCQIEEDIKRIEVV